MKLDIKTILILVLLAISLVFGWNWYFGGGKEFRNKIKQLEKERKELLKERDVLINRSDSLLYINKVLEINDSIQRISIERRDKEIKTLKATSTKTRKELEETRNRLLEIRKQIDWLRKNPMNRTGEDLLKSIKEKTQ